VNPYALVFMLGIPATGKRYELRGLLINRLVDGKIIEEQDYREDLDMLRQIGLVTL
jgi:predicted ester cyclase